MFKIKRQNVKRNVVSVNFDRVVVPKLAGINIQ